MTGRAPLADAAAQIRRALVAVGGVSLFVNLLMLVSPLYMMQVFDRVLVSGRVETLLYLTAMAIFALAVLAALDHLRGRALVGTGLWLDRKLGPEIVRASAAAGARDGQALRDLATVRSFIGGPSIHPLLDAPWTPLFVGAMALLHPWLGAMALAASILLFALGWANDRIARMPSRRAGQAAIAAQEQADSALRNADTVRAMGMLPAALRRWAAFNEDSLNLQALAAGRAGLALAAARFVRLAVQILVLGLGAFLVLRNELTPGGMIAGSILLGRALAPVEQAIGSWRGATAARVAYGRIRDLLTTAPPPAPPMRLPPAKGHVTVESMGYAPPGAGRPVLRDVSFSLSPGECLGIIGPSASGKSTLCRLLAGSLVPGRGHVRLDGAELHHWGDAGRARHVGYLPQEVELFRGSVKDNIARLDVPDPDLVVEAAQLAGVHDMILGLPDAYDTEIGPGGAFLSGGQRQRIALARALYRRPALLVLDEASSNLDAEGEAALRACLAQLKREGATIVTVAHRPAALEQADRILVLRDGRVDLLGDRAAIFEQLAPRPSVRVASVGGRGG